MKYACGVDFGTSNSTVGWLRQGVPGLLALEQDKNTLPSVVFFNAEEDRISYGRQALGEYLGGDEGRLMRSMKSLLGTSLIDGQTEVQGRALAFRDLLTQFITELKRRAESSAGQCFDAVVMGRPVHFIDDDRAADQQAEQTLREIAQKAGFGEVLFQYEPIAAAFCYETGIQSEQLVLIADIGGGTSDFSLVRLGPERIAKTDRQADILANGGVHIGGTDFDKYLSLNQFMPLLGYGAQLASGLEIPSSYYFNLATWHTINLAYTQKVWRELQEVNRDIANPDTRGLFERLLNLIQDRDGHWLAIKAEQAKIDLSAEAAIEVELERLRNRTSRERCRLSLSQTVLDLAIDPLCEQVAAQVSLLLRDAGLKPEQVDTVFFTGGSSGVHALRQKIAACVPAARQVEGDLFGSIGSGLALDAARRFG